MRNRGRTAARVTGVVAAAALVFGVMGPAGAATRDVEYALGTGTVQVGANNYALPEATGIVGTWDDVSGAFDGVFTSDLVATTQSVTSPLAGTIELTYQFVATENVTGTIDPATGSGNLATTFNVVVTLQQLRPTATPDTPIVLDQICTIAGVPVSYAVTATGIGPDSEIFTDLSLTASGFPAPAATCVAGPAGNPALTPTVQTTFNESAGLPTQSTSSTATFTAGAVPPPSTTTSTSATPTTAPPVTVTPSSTSTTTPGSNPANPVRTNPNLAG